MTFTLLPERFEAECWFDAVTLVYLCDVVAINNGCNRLLFALGTGAVRVASVVRMIVFNLNKGIVNMSKGSK